MKWLKDKYWRWIEKQYLKRNPPPRIIPKVYSIDRKTIYCQRFTIYPNDPMPNINELKRQFVENNIDRIAQNVDWDITDNKIYLEICLTMFVGGLSNER